MSNPEQQHGPEYGRVLVSESWPTSKIIHFSHLPTLLAGDIETNPGPKPPDFLAVSVVKPAPTIGEPKQAYCVIHVTPGFMRIVLAFQTLFSAS